MAKQQVPINEIPYKNIENVALSIYSDRLIDGYLEKIENKLVLKKRAGLGNSVLQVGTNNPINGLHWWEGKGFYLSVSDAKCYKVNKIGATYSSTIISGTSDIINDTPIIFDDWGDDVIGHKCLIASGGKLCYIEDSAINTARVNKAGSNYSVNDVLQVNSGNSDAEITVTSINGSGGVEAFTITASGTGYSKANDVATFYDGTGNGFTVDITNLKECINSITDADAPSEVTHVIVVNRYAIVNKKGSSEWYYSDVNDMKSWSALSFENAEADPDKIMAILKNQEKVYVVGTKTTEIWYNDGVTPWQRYGVVPRGTISPYSALFIEGILYFIDQNKEFVRVINGQYQPISESFNRYIKTFGDISDAIAMNITVGGKKLYVINFPTAQKTLFYDYMYEYWGELGLWNDLSGYSHFLGNCYAYSPVWGVNLVGSRINDKLYDMSESKYMDDAHNIRTEKTTGNIDYGIKNRKRTQYLRLSLLRGNGLANDVNTAPKALLKFRDNGCNVWSSEYEIDLGKIGETCSIIELNRLGMYQTRQYGIVHSDNSPFMLVSMEEELESMSR